jgi:hypothetical protein
MKQTALLRTLRWLVAATVIIVVVVAGWQFVVVGADDPRDLRYQGWKLGLYPLRIDAALNVMINDSHRDSLVVGKTSEELDRRFGSVSPVPGNTYVKNCYENSPYRGTSVLFIRNSNWMVLMKDGVADGLVLAKGC